jgi:type I restriction enzyme M protein
LLSAHDFIASHNTLDKTQWRYLNHDALYGWEIVDNTARLCVMNLYLHGVGVDGRGEGDQERSPIHVDDALAKHPGEYFDMVLTNPPFGKFSSVTFVTEEGDLRRESQDIVREDFWTSTSNKQINFVQHVRSILKQNGRTAVVAPDNVLFDGGAGETLRRRLLKECDVHTLLRLPTGIFYKPGVKANVILSTANQLERKPG